MDKEIYIDSCGTKRHGTKRVCENCKNEYLTRHDKLHRKQKFCSRKCVIEFKNKNNKIQVECAFCKRKFLKLINNISNSKSGLFFCNRQCKDSAQKLGGLKEIMPDHYGKKITRIKKKDIKFRFEDIKLECIDCKENKEYLLNVHHIDGISSNNTKENIEIVCANCHTKRHLEFKNGKWTVNYKVLTPRDKLKEL